MLKPIDCSVVRVLAHFRVSFGTASGCTFVQFLRHVWPRPPGICKLPKLRFSLTTVTEWDRVWRASHSTIS